MKETTCRKVREDFTELANAVAFNGETVVVMRNRKPLVAMVSIEDLERLQAAAKVTSKK